MENENEDNESMGLSPEDTLRRLILEKRESVLSCINKYQEYRAHGASYPITYIRSNLIALFFELQASLKRCLKKEEYELVKENIHSSKYELLIDGYMSINEWLDEKNLTRLDNITNKTKKVGF